MAKHILPASVAAIGTASLVWNALGGMVAVRTVSLGPEQLAAMSQAQQQLHLMTPSWANWALLVAVGSGLLGSLGLIRGRSWAAPWFLLSALAVLVQLVGTFSRVSPLQGLGQGGMLFPALLLAACAYLWAYSHRARARGWLQ